jgi:hypothetical protein
LTLLRDATRATAGWSATGLFTDSGSWTDPFAAAGGLPSPVVFELEIKTIETSATGTFHMNFQGHGNLVTGRDFSGTWTITPGTGAYSRLHGSGTWTIAADANDGRIITARGVVHFD